MNYEEMQAVVRIDCVIDFVKGMGELKPEDAPSYDFVIRKLEETKQILQLD